MAVNEDKLKEYNTRWVDAYFNHAFNGKMTSLSLKPHLTVHSAEQDATRMLGKVEVQKLIEIKRENIRLKQQIKLEDIVAGLQRIITDCESEGTEYDANGRIMAKPDRKSALAAYAQLSKLAGLDQPQKIDITTNGKDLTPIINISIIKPKDE